MELRLPELPGRARPDASGAPARTQESVAVSADGDSLGPAQLLAGDPPADRELPAACIRAGRATRRSPRILLTNGDLDHSSGLLSLRESHPLVVYATDRVRRGFIEGNVLYRTLERFPGQVDLAAAQARA